MRIAKPEHAGLNELASLVAAQVLQAIFSDHAETTINGGFCQTFALNGYFAIHKQVELGEFVHEGARAHHSLFELLAERQHALGGIGWLGTVEQWFSFTGSDLAGGVIEAQRQIVALGRQTGEHEWVTAHECGNVLTSFPLIIGAQIEIAPFLQANERERRRVVAEAEYDRVKTLHDGEFIDSDRNRMGLAAEGEVRTWFETMRRMKLRRQWNQTAIKKRQALFRR